jgi:PilZ domain-containing protein
MAEPTKATGAAERREFPRIPFKAASLVIETNSAQIVVAPTRELSRFGCFVETTKTLPRRSRIQIEIADGRDIFRASGMVAYVAADGMGIAFGLVEADNHEILAKWLSRTPR